MNSAPSPALTLRVLFATAALAASAGAFAQTSPPAPSNPAKTITDVGPSSPEDRGSLGAIVIENAPVRAQRGLAERAPPLPGAAADRAVAQQPDTRVLGAGPAPAAKPVAAVEGDAPKKRRFFTNPFNRSADGDTAVGH